jgi:hypothetical protein
MKTTLHLVAMPFDRTTTPSIQLGCLQAYVDRAFAGRVVTHAYSAFFGIVVRPATERLNVRRNPLFDTVTALEGMTARRRGAGKGTFELLPRHLVGELPYFLLYHRRYGTDAARAALAGSLRGAVSGADVAEWIAETCTDDNNLRALEEATIAYAERRIVPSLSADGVNVVGFSCTFNQTYASAYCMRWLQERCPSHRFLFVFGGSAVGMPSTTDTLRRLELDALCVVGEGEPKLHQLLDGCLAADEGADLVRTLEDASCGILDAKRFYDLRVRNPAYTKKQLKSLDVLPCPDYDEFFAELSVKCASTDEHDAATSQLEIPLEGSRGCAFACTFCNLNHLWTGYRKQDVEIIRRHVNELRQKYGTPTTRIRFVDNLCNWATAFADLLIEHGERAACFLELRARYPEPFWRKLKAIGTWCVQIGIEALSTDLLTVMNKKARALDNVRAMKFMAEQDVPHGSNFILNYPGSNLEHVEETRRVLSHLTHLPRLASTDYDLVEGSPLYYDLPDDAKASLVSRRALHYDPVLEPFVTDYAFAVPDTLAPPAAIVEAWRAVDEWYKHAPLSTFTCEWKGEELVICDDRWGERTEVRIAGMRAVILDACHRGLSLETIVELTGLDVETTRALVDELVARRLLLSIDGHVINVARRPAHEVAGLELAEPRRLAPEVRDVPRRQVRLAVLA